MNQKRNGRNGMRFQESAEGKQMDEKMMLTGQESLLKNKNTKKKNTKNKKNRKGKIILAAAVLVLAAAVGIGYLKWGKHSGAAQEKKVQIVTAAGQKIVYAALTDVRGNEITYREAQESQNPQSQKSQSFNPQDEETPRTRDEMPESEEGRSWGAEDENGETTDGNRGQREAPDGGMPQPGEAPDGEMPQPGETPDGEMPQQGQAPDGEMSQQGQAPGGEVPRQDGETLGTGGRSDGETTGLTDSFWYDGLQYDLSEETVTAMIPVGCEVTTKLGTVTTFSRLAAGDKVALVVSGEGEEQTIVSVYIIG